MEALLRDLFQIWLIGSVDTAPSPCSLHKVEMILGQHHSLRSSCIIIRRLLMSAAWVLQPAQSLCDCGIHLHQNRFAFLPFERHSIFNFTESSQLERAGWVYELVLGVVPRKKQAITWKMRNSRNPQISLEPKSPDSAQTMGEVWICRTHRSISERGEFFTCSQWNNG